MNRLPTALLSALEAAIAAVVGLAALLVPMSLLWAVQFGMSTDFAVFWRATGVVWLLGHGADVTMTLDEAFAATVGLDQSARTFPVTVALLGLGLVTALFARRIGVRATRAGHPVVGIVSAALVVGAIGSLVAATSTSAATEPGSVQAALLPALVAGVAAAVGAIGESLRAGALDAEEPGPIALRVALLPHGLVSGVRAAFRGGVGAAALLLGAAAIVVAVSVFVRFADVVAVFQALQTGVVGGIAVSVAQLSVLPNIVVWAAAWLLGPGFAVGAGSAIGPTEQVAGAVPALPIAALLPAGTGIGLVCLVVPISAGVAAGMLLQRSERSDAGIAVTAARAGGAALVAASLLALAAWWSGGAIGPGRLGEVGPDPLAVLLFALGAVGVPLVAAATIAAAVDARDLARLPQSRILPTDRYDVGARGGSAVPTPTPTPTSNAKAVATSPEPAEATARVAAAVAAATGVVGPMRADPGRSDPGPASTP
ncbi:DUF6350 family protein, partial [Agromyces seonyuensis]